MNTTLSLLTKNVRGVLAASAAFSVMATAPVYAQEAEESAKAEDYANIVITFTPGLKPMWESRHFQL